MRISTEAFHLKCRFVSHLLASAAHTLVWKRQFFESHIFRVSSYYIEIFKVFVHSFTFSHYLMHIRVGGSSSVLSAHVRLTNCSFAIESCAPRFDWIIVFLAALINIISG
jgi:hypothetical protein